jgi:16S rRNA processing protein RimM
VDAVVLGEIVGVFGIHGELRVHLHHREGATLAEPRDVELVTAAGRRTVRMGIRSGAGKRIIGRIDGVDTPEAAAALMGARIEVDRASLPVPEEGEYFVHDLLGLRVVDDAGTEHGTITDVVAGPVDVWVLGDGAAFVMATKEAIRAVDLEGGVVRVADGSVDAG